ncbi:hypothetical protein HGA91_05530 [candidate division WWE3 bacterium]|nr:hypothetical protein [candidate division WWE3 bacterium]
MPVVQWFMDGSVPFGQKFVAGEMILIVIVSLGLAVLWVVQEVQSKKPIEEIIAHILVNIALTPVALAGPIVVFLFLVWFFAMLTWGTMCGFQGPMLECIVNATKDARYP